MLFIKYLLMTGGIGMILIALGILAHDLTMELQYRRAMAAGEAAPLPAIPKLRWRTAMALAMLAWAPILIALSIVVVPSGTAGVRVSQTQGTLAGTLYPGVHFVIPLLEKVELFDTRDQLFTTGSIEDGKTAAGATVKAQPLNVQAKEGLTVGLAITVRYRVDSKRLDYVEANLPQPVEKEIVPPVVASVWRELVPNYTVRDVFAAKREEVRTKAANLITQKLAADGIVVKEVMLRDIQLPPEYAKGLETLLLKEQENDRMGVDTEIQQKQVRIAELQAEATKVQQVKQAEGEAQVHVLQAKGEADAEADRIRVTAAADAERMKGEAAVLKQNPLLINKIVAERLSDKLQIMMVPADGKFFFANDVLRSMNMANRTSQAEAPEDPQDKEIET